MPRSTKVVWSGAWHSRQCRFASSVPIEADLSFVSVCISPTSEMRGIAKAVADATGALLAINPTHTVFLSSSQRQTVKPGAHGVQVGPGKVNDFFAASILRYMHRECSTREGSSNLKTFVPIGTSYFSSATCAPISRNVCRTPLPLMLRHMGNTRRLPRLCPP
jgi:hypothetical protein